MDENMKFDYIWLDIEYGKMLRDIAGNILANMDVATTVVEKVLCDSQEQFEDGSFDKDEVKDILILEVRNRCLDELKNVDYTTVIIKDSFANLLPKLSKSYVACNRSRNLNDKYEKVKEVMKEKGIILSHIISELDQNDYELLIRRYFYFQPTEKIVKQQNRKNTDIQNIENELRKKFKNRYFELCKKFDIDKTVFEQKKIKFAAMKKEYSERFSYSEDYKKAMELLSEDCVTDYCIANVLRALNYKDLSKYEDIVIESEDLNKSSSLLNGEKIEDFEEFFDDYVVDDEDTEDTSIQVVKKKKNIVSLFSFTFTLIIFSILVYFSISLLGDSSINNMLPHSKNKIVHSSTSKEMGLTFEYYKNLQGDFDVQIKEDYYVNNNFISGSSHIYGENFKIDNKKKENFFKTLKSDDKVDGTVKFVHCKKLNMLYIIEYNDGKWECVGSTKSNELSADSKIDFTKGKISNIQFYADSKYYTAIYSNDYDTYRIRFLNDDESMEKENYTDKDKKISISKVYNEESKKNEYQATLLKADISVDEFIGGYYIFENNIKYLDLYYFYKNKDVFLSEFICRVAVDDIYENIDNISDYSKIDAFDIQKIGKKFFFSNNNEEINNSPKYKIGEYCYTGYCYDGYENLLLEEVEFIDVSTGEVLTGDNGKKIETFIFYRDDIYENTILNNEKRDEELKNIYSGYKGLGDKAVQKTLTLSDNTNDNITIFNEYKYNLYDDCVEILECSFYVECQITCKSCGEFCSGVICENCGASDNYYEEEYNFIIPSEIDGKPVKYIANNAFCFKLSETNLYSNICITVPGTVEEIGSKLFLNSASGPSIKKIVLEEGVKTLGDKAFDGCVNLQEVQLPESLEIIGDGCFDTTKWCGENIETLTSEECVYINNILYKYLGDKIDEVIVKDGTIGIANGAFFNCNKIKKIVLPDSLKYIGSSAFASMDNLEYIELGQNVEYIGKAAFSKCRALSRINIPSSVKVINSKTFEFCKELRYVEFSEGVKIIQPNVFKDVDKLEGVLIPNSVVNISSSFMNKEGCMIICNENSYASDFATKYDFDYKIKK